MEMIYLVAGFIIGIILTWIILNVRKSADIKVSAEKERMLAASLAETQQKLEEKENRIIELNGNYAASEAQQNNLRQQLEQQKKDLEQLQKRFNAEFENLANRILEEKTKKFTEQNKTNLEAILNPLSERIREFRDKVDSTYGEERKERFHLGKEIEKLVTMNQRLSDDAKNLTRALKGESKTQGNWGEMILETILEKSGLTRDREYFVQSSFTTDEGKRIQPDILVRYPGDRYVVIDSKVSLTAYERYIGAADDAEREQAVKDHLSSVKKHIQELSQKNYQTIYNHTTLDFVMLFMPVEPGYYLALQADPELWSYAYERRILLMSPTNLLAALKMIESMWRMEYQNANAREIARQSGDLLDKFRGFLDEMNKVGGRITDAQLAWEDAMKKLSTGKGNLLSRAKKIQELGARPKKELPDPIKGAEEDDEEQNTNGNPVLH